jgi:hypothetical protein
MSVADGLLNVTGNSSFRPQLNSSIFNRYHWCITSIFNSSIAVSVCSSNGSCSTGDCYSESFVILIKLGICRGRYYCSYGVAPAKKVTVTGVVV